MNFVLVNHRALRRPSCCAACALPLQQSYLRDLSTHSRYCSVECYPDRAAGSMVGSRAKADSFDLLFYLWCYRRSLSMSCQQSSTAHGATRRARSCEHRSPGQTGNQTSRTRTLTWQRRTMHRNAVQEVVLDVAVRMNDWRRVQHDRVHH